jgi:type IX secretion system PorP/SprF family membrane protein
MYIGGAFHKSLDNTRRQYLGGGFQIGMNQRNINYSKINFQDSFNGIDGYTLPTLEVLPENNFAHGDLSAGINYTFTPNKRTAFLAGLAVHHILGVENSFFKRDPRPDVNTRGESFRLPARYTGHLAMSFTTSEFVSIQPRVMVSSQGQNISSVLGSNFRFSFLNSDVSTLTMGAYVRMANGSTNWASDMLGFLVGYGYDNLFMGMSYDFSINSVSRYGRSRGSFELSISYFGLYEHDDLFCPTF